MLQRPIEQAIYFYFFLWTCGIRNKKDFSSILDGKADDWSLMRNYFGRWAREYSQTRDTKMVDFWFLWIAWQFQTPICFPAVKTGVNPGIRSWKKHLSDWAWCQKAIGGIYFTKKWRAETLQPGLEFDNFKPRLKSSIFKCISWMNSSFFGGDDRGFLKEEVNTNLMASMSPLNSPTFFLCSDL
jgi:hypothetical protein